MLVGQGSRINLIFPGIVLTFFATTGVFFSLLLPIFQGPDEQIHYATVQKWAEPKTDTNLLNKSDYDPQSNGIQSFRLQEEVTQAALLNRFDEIKWQSTNTPHFIPQTTWGEGEREFLASHYKRSIVYEYSGISGTWSWYYAVASSIESSLRSSDFFTRFFSVRFFSITLGLITLVIGWYYFLTLKFTPKEAWVLSIILATQPMFLATASIVNIDIALVVSFSLFTLISTLILTQGFSWLLGSLLVAASILGLGAKGPGIVLLVLFIPLAFFIFPHSIKFSKKLILHCTLFFLGILLAMSFVPPNYISDITRSHQPSVFSSSFHSLKNYVEKSFSSGTLSWSHGSYWGNFGWLDTPLPGWTLSIILSIEIISLFGILSFFFNQKTPSYLPSKKLVFWALTIVVALQLAIRFFDWRVFDTTGHILIGTPGRYFLPTFIPYTVLLVTGLGWFTHDRHQFISLLKVLASFSILLLLYSIWHILIPRYYL